MRSKLVILLITLLGAFTPAKSTHIVGGDLTYLHLGDNNYEITLKLYIDCVNGSPGAILQDSTAIIVVYDTAKNLIDSIGVFRNTPRRVEATAYSCVIPPTNACVDLYVYKDTIYLPPIPGGYTLAFQRCCRNTTLNNVVNPLRTGSTYWTYISDTTDFGYNSSPVFDSLPPNFLCTNNPLIFDHGATDPDGDSLVYELCVPFDGGTFSSPRPARPYPPPYPHVTWRAPYDKDNMMGGAPILKIDSATGLLTVTPDMIGQYVVGICVKEYRDGVLIGRTMRDYQFNVLNCNFSVVSSFASPSLTCSRSVFFNNYSSGAANFSWDFGVSGIDTDTSTKYAPTFNYPDTGNFTIRLIAKSGNCIDTFETPIHVVDAIDVFAGNDTNICLKDTIYLGEEDHSGMFNYYWTGPGLSENDVSNPYAVINSNSTFVVTKTRGNCEARDTVNVNVLKPIAQIGSKLTCNKEVHFQNNSSGANSYFWDFGDHIINNDTSNVVNPVYTYSISGTYTVTLTVVNGKCADVTTRDIVILDDFKVNAGRDTFLCPGQSVKLGEDYIDPSFEYEWTPEEFLDNRFVSSPTSTPEKTTEYVVIKKAGEDCYATDTVLVSVVAPSALFDTSSTSDCEGVEYSFENLSNFAYEYIWQFSTGEEYKQYIPENKKIYFEEEMEVSLIANNEGCSDTFIHNIKAPSLFDQFESLPNVFTPGSDGMNDCFRVTDNPKLEPCYEMIIYNRWGEIIFKKPEDGMCWDGSVPQTGRQVPEGTYYYIFKAGGRSNSGTITLIR